MKLFGEILQCIDCDRTWKLNSFIDEVDTPRTNCWQFIPARTVFEDVNGNPPSSDKEESFRRTRDDRLHADMRPLLINIVGNGATAGRLNNLRNERALPNCDNRIE